MGALLVRHLIESTLLCLLLGAIAASLQRQRAAVRHALWLIGVSKLLAPTFLLTATGAQLAFLLPATAWISYLAARASAPITGLIWKLAFSPFHRCHPKWISSIVGALVARFDRYVCRLVYSPGPKPLYAHAGRI